MKNKNILKYCLNKYTITALLFLVWVAFIDKHSIVEHIRINRNISRIKQEMQQCRQSAQQNRARLRELKTSTAALERFARERYHMRAPNEDMFLIEE